MQNINPYTLMFGKESVQMIARVPESDEIYQNFLTEASLRQAYMITGIRGVGKLTCLFGESV